MIIRKEDYIYVYITYIYYITFTDIVVVFISIVAGSLVDPLGRSISQGENSALHKWGQMRSGKVNTLFFFYKFSVEVLFITQMHTMLFD